MAKFKRNITKKINHKDNISKLSEILNLAVIAHQRGKLSQAERHYHEVLNCSPTHVTANHNLGLILCHKKDYDHALIYISKAIKEKPDFPEAHFNYGNVLLQKGQLSEALISFNKAISLKPSFSEAHINIGNIYKELHKYGRAIDSFKLSINIQSNNARAHYNLGNIYKEQGNFTKALQSFQRAIALKPNHYKSYNNLGNTQQSLYKYHEAIVSYKKAIEISADFAEAHNNLGNIYKKQGQLGKGISSLHTAIKLNPQYSEAYNNLASIYKHKGDFDNAIDNLKRALELDPSYIECQSNLLFYLNYTKTPQQKIFEKSKRWSQHFPTHIETIKHNQRIQNYSKLKVGYVSADFRHHSVAYFFKPLIKNHNNEKFEIYCYSNVSAPDETTQHIKNSADHWISVVGNNTEQIVKLIQEDQIDVLVDLAGHTANNRLDVFLHKPAPVQITWLGYPNTTGLDTIDYRFTDSIADPLLSDNELYSEELYRLSNSFLCYQADKSAPDIAEYSPVNRPITFGSFNNLTKVNSEVIKTWAGILLSVPGSQLLLKSTQLADVDLCEQIKEQFLALGVNLNRIELYGKIPNTEDHFKLYNKVDIALDPFPYNGTTTTFEALWMGVPVITLRGLRHSGRVGASIMHHLGKHELIAETLDEYVHKAIELANDKDRLIENRLNLREQLSNSTLCDAQSFAEKIESAYQDMWKMYCDNYPSNAP